MSVAGNSSIYVGDLAEEAAEEHLWQVFSQAGQIVSVRRCRDVLPNKRLNYGYVNFARPEDAQRAVSTLNHVLICNRPVRVMLSQRDGSQRRSGVGNVFVKNLHPYLVTNKVLHDHFQQVGAVLSAKVATDQHGLSKKYGFVQYEEPESAHRAIDALNQTELCGQPLVVTKFISAKDRASEPGKYCNVYVKGLGSAADEETLRSAFSRFGPISSTAIMRNAQMKSRGFGFVNFENADDAAKAVAEMDGYSHEGQLWKVDRAQKRNEGAAKEKLHQTYVQVKNLSPSVSEEQLRSIFEGFGPLESARMLLGPEGVSTGTAVVQFQSSEDAEAAIIGLNNYMEGDQLVPWSVSLAPRRAQGPQEPGRASQQRAGPSSTPWRGSPVPFLQHPPPLMTPNFNFFEGPQFFYQPTFLGQQSGRQQAAPGYMPLGPHQVSTQPVYDPAGNLIGVPVGNPYQGRALPTVGNQGPMTPLVRMASSQSSQYMPLEGYHPTGSRSWAESPTSTAGNRKGRGRSLTQRQSQPGTQARALPDRTDQASQSQSVQRSGTQAQPQQGAQSSLPPIAQDQYFSDAQEGADIIAMPTGAYAGRGQFTSRPLPGEASRSKPATYSDMTSQQIAGPQHDLDTRGKQADAPSEIPTSRDL